MGRGGGRHGQAGAAKHQSILRSRRRSEVGLPAGIGNTMKEVGETTDREYLRQESHQRKLEVNLIYLVAPGSASVTKTPSPNSSLRSDAANDATNACGMVL